MFLVVTVLGLAVATLGSKVVLALIFIYYLLPDERGCAACGGETIRLVTRGIWRVLGSARLQRRWCPACGRSALARSGRVSGTRVGPTSTEALGGVEERAPPSSS